MTEVNANFVFGDAALHCLAGRVDISFTVVVGVIVSMEAFGCYVPSCIVSLRWPC